MPSKFKKLVRERMKKTRESYATAERQVRAAFRIKEGQYAGTPKMAKWPTTHWFDEHYQLLPDSNIRPQVDFVNIQGEFDPNDLSKAWVPESAFDDPLTKQDPTWQPGVLRVLTLAEYIDARSRQTGWRLDRIEPGRAVNFGPFWGGEDAWKVLTVTLQWDSRPGAGRRAP